MSVSQRKTLTSIFEDSRETTRRYEESLDYEGLAEIYGEENLARELVKPTVAVKHFCFACNTADKNNLIYLFQLYKKYPTVMALVPQDYWWLLHGLLGNKRLTDQKLAQVLQVIDHSMLNQVLILKIDGYCRFLLMDAVMHNRPAFFDTVQQHVNPDILFIALIQNNHDGSAIDYFYDDLATFRAICQLFSPWLFAFYGVLIESPKRRIEDIIDRWNAELKIQCHQFVTLLRKLINPSNHQNNTDFIKEVANACACIAQGKPIILPDESATLLSFVTPQSNIKFFVPKPKRFPDLEQRLKDVNAEQVMFFFHHVLPFVSARATSNSKVYVDMLINEFNKKLQPAVLIQQPAEITSTSSLEPVYDGKLDEKWIALKRKQAVIESILEQQSTLLRDKKDTSDHSTARQQVLSALEHRQLACRQLEETVTRLEEEVTRRLQR